MHNLIFLGPIHSCGSRATVTFYWDRPSWKAALPLTSLLRWKNISLTSAQRAHQQLC